jgi:hypothetical protein
MNNPGARKALAFGAAVIAGGAVSGAAQAQSIFDVARDANGHPILQGMYTGGGFGGQQGVEERIQTYNGRGNSYVGLEADGAVRRTSNDNLPPYRPQYWDQVTNNDYMGNWEDPVSHCYPLGIPRSGAPHAIFKPEGLDALILVYGDGFNGYNGSYRGWDAYRWVPLNVEHDANYVAAETFQGAGVGHWEGDTLVIETVGFTDETWLHKNGWMHGFDMKVTERIARVGDQLVWSATVEDPEFFTGPWEMTPMLMEYRGTGEGWTFLGEGNVCLVREPYGSHTRSG